MRNQRFTAASLLVGCFLGGQLRFHPILFGRTLLHCPYFPREGQERRILSLCPATEPPMTEVTAVLSASEDGDPCDAEQLLPLVYDELRQLAPNVRAR